jgi:hypothetical protein
MGAIPRFIAAALNNPAPAYGSWQPLHQTHTASIHSSKTPGLISTRNELSTQLRGNNIPVTADKPAGRILQRYTALNTKHGNSKTLKAGATQACCGFFGIALPHQAAQLKPACRQCKDVPYFFRTRSTTQKTTKFCGQVQTTSATHLRVRSRAIILGRG